VEKYKEEFLDDLPGINDPMKSFLQIVFNQGFQRGRLAMLSTYVATIMFQSQLEAIIGNPEQSNDNPPPQPTQPKVNINDLLRSLHEQMNNGDLDTTQN
jgi:hypothetical protein